MSEDKTNNVIQFPRQQTLWMSPGPYLTLIQLSGVFVGSVTATAFGYACVNIHKGFVGFFDSYDEAKQAVSEHVTDLCSFIAVPDYLPPEPGQHGIEKFSNDPLN